ncbi:hypothetical protein GGQ54_000305 [Naumannella cuiyingiana]|uniref:KANL3/Tex30 alpha/beta hydrolase-like domain-containing protein n=1 Tax=Naumannella cuiyingiana TaxID=1347891 RepID=A0A7Z0D6E2_9ACTN|nr:alpha/beta family hydrolase [Naumannella cuiyingiana]NYI69745.1 hypothetical protein [Naumannella cuiyingiana]
MKGILVETPLGPGRLHLSGDPAGTWFLLGHGAGGGIDALDLALLADRLPGDGVGVARYEQPWRLAGRKVAPAPARLDEGWLPAVAALRAAVAPARLITGGRSAGARVACRTAPATGADAVLCCAFPLHPPGRPDRSRLPELLGAGVPVAVVQGTRDTFGTADELAAATGEDGGVAVFCAPDADHGMKTPARADPVPARNAVLAAARSLIAGE